MNGNGRYGIEVWSKSGERLGDIRHLCSGLKWSKQRNEAEELSFDMDLAEYEDYLSSIGVRNPFEFIDVLGTDLRVTRDGQYLFGANVTKIQYAPDDPSVRMSIDARGYLNFFKTAYVDIAYANTPQGSIAWGVINQYQQKEGGNYGITYGGHIGSVNKSRDRNFVRKNVKDFLQQLSNVIEGLDFEFTADKKFITYDAMGSHRPDIRLVYPDNIDSFSFDRDGSSVGNFIYGIGSGNGDDAIFVTAQDPNSYVPFYRREAVKSFNSVEREDTLEENTNGVLEIMRDVAELPTLTFHDGVLNLNDIKVGDTVYVKLSNFKSIEHIDGDQRIEKISCDVDVNDAETPSLTFDDLNVDDIIAQQEEAAEE